MSLIAVTGATGELGGRVARRLADRGMKQRLVVRDAARAPALDGAETATFGGYADHDGLRDALQGIETLYLVPAAEATDRIEQHKTAVDAAVAAGVQRIVYASFLNASADATFTLVRHHWATEEHIRTKDVAHVFPRMSMYMDFIPSMVGEDGAIRGPAGDGRMGAILRDDLADVAAAILADPAPHDGTAFNVTGPESFSFADVAATMSRATGRQVTYVEETIDEAWASRRATGAPDWMIEGWVSSYVAVANGDLDAVTDAVPRITGHEATSLEEYVSRSAAEPTSP
jgi:uncharacterized protein YbjT (DUF2867 family)